jgi:hypothetical protein
MPDISPQHFGGPIAVPAPRVDVGTSSAPTSVFTGGPPPTWMNLLPQAPSPNDALQAQQLQLKISQAREQQNAQNAMAQLFRDPSNLDANGMVKPEAIAKLGGAGFPGQALELMSTQAELGQKQMAVKMNQQKFLQGEQAQLVESFEPLVGEYDDNVKKYGEARAREIGQQRYSELLEKARSSGLYSSQLMEQASPTFDPERLRRTVLGLEKSQSMELARKAADRADTDSARGSMESVRNFTYTDEKGQQQTQALRYDKDNSTYYTGDNRPVRGTNFREVGSQSVDLTPKFTGQVPDGNGGTRQVDAAFVGTNPPGQRYVDPETSKPYENLTNVRQKTPSDVEDPDAERATAEQIARYQLRPYTGMSARSPRAVRIMKEVQEINPNYREGKFAAAVATERDFASGVTSRRVDALNTAIQHLEVFEDVSKALQNGDVSLKNRVVNYVRSNIAGNEEVTDFNTASQIIADEAIKAVISSGGGVTDRKGLHDQLASDRSGAQFEGQKKTLERLLAGQFGSLAKRWKAAGLPADDFQAKMLPATVDALGRYLPAKEREDLGIGGSSSSDRGELRPPIASGNAPAVSPAVSPAAPGGAPGAPGAAASSAAPPQEIVDKMPEGKAVTLQTPGGPQRWIKRNGKAERVAE